MAKWQHFITAAATTAALSASTLVFADHGHDPFSESDGDERSCKHEKKDRGDPEKRLKRLAKKLDLTEEQQTQLKGRMEQDQASDSARKESMKTLREKLQKAAKDNASEEEIHKLADQLGDLIAEGAIARANKKKTMDEILTAEQQKEFAALMEKMRERGSKKHKKKD